MKCRNLHFDERGGIWTNTKFYFEKDGVGWRNMGKYKNAILRKIEEYWKRENSKLPFEKAIQFDFKYALTLVYYIFKI